MKNQNSAGKRKKPTKLVSAAPKVTIHKMPTGVRGLDEILGGGIPEFSFNIIAGTPGCGKTTLAHQIIFANATIKKPAIYFTVLGEPALKMLRYQQQYSFFDASKVGKAIRFINLSDVVLGKNLDAVLDEIIQQVTTLNPSVVVVDSFRTVVRKAMADESELEMQTFIQHHVSGGRIHPGRDARQSDLHRRRWSPLAFATDGEKFRGAEIANFQAARSGLGARIAHLPHPR